MYTVYIKTKTPKKPFGSDRKEEDSLENTFSCVPKVQGEGRISQANGQRTCDRSAEQSFWGCAFLFCERIRKKELQMYGKPIDSIGFVNNSVFFILHLL